MVWTTRIAHWIWSLGNHPRAGGEDSMAGAEKREREKPRAGESPPGRPEGTAEVVRLKRQLKQSYHGLDRDKLRECATAKLRAIESGH